MREINGYDFFEIDHKTEVFIIQKEGKPIQALSAPSDPKNLPWLFKTAVSTVIGTLLRLTKAKGMWLGIGELREVNTIMDSDDAFLWYESDNEEGVYFPIKTPDAIRKWVASEGMKLYEVV